MAKYTVSLTKSYKIEVTAESEEEAMKLTEFFTSDSQDLSSDEDKNKYNFEIHNIECTINQSFDCDKIYE